MARKKAAKAVTEGDETEPSGDDGEDYAAEPGEGTWAWMART